MKKYWKWFLCALLVFTATFGYIWYHQDVAFHQYDIDMVLPMDYASSGIYDFGLSYHRASPQPIDIIGIGDVCANHKVEPSAMPSQKNPVIRKEHLLSYDIDTTVQILLIAPMDLHISTIAYKEHGVDKQAKIGNVRIRTTEALKMKETSVMRAEEEHALIVSGNSDGEKIVSASFVNEHMDAQIKEIHSDSGEFHYKIHYQGNRDKMTISNIRYEERMMAGRKQGMDRQGFF